MRLKINSIITLENSKKYLLLNEVEYQDANYFLAIGVTKEKELIPNNVAILKCSDEDSMIYVEIMEDPFLIMKLTNIMKTQI